MLSSGEWAPIEGWDIHIYTLIILRNLHQWHIYDSMFKNSIQQYLVDC